MTVPARDTSAAQNYTYRYVTDPNREYEINFKFLADDENITAFLRMIDGTKFDLSEGTHYSIKFLSGNNNIWGSLKFGKELDLPPEEEVDYLCIYRKIPNDQNKAYDSQTIFSSITEYCLDKLTMLVQDYVQNSKFVRAPVDAELDPSNLELPPMNDWTSEKVLGFNDNKKLTLFDYSNPVSNRGLRQPNEETPDPSFVISVEERANKVVGFNKDGQVDMIFLDKVPEPSDATPLADGEAAPGTSDEYSRGNHVHPITPDATTNDHGLMSSADKTKLNGIAAGAQVNVKPDWNAAAGTAQEILNKPEDATTNDHGLMSAADKTKLNGIAAGAQVNVKPDWNAAAGTAQEILNKPLIVKRTNYRATLSTTWSGSDGNYYQTVSVPGITGNDMPIVDVIIFNTFDTATALATIAAWAKVGRITTDANSITAYCYEDFPPDIALSMVLVVIS